MKDLKLGLQMGYWGAGPDPQMVAIAQEAERLGYDALFTAEAWGSDVFTPLAWIGAHTSRIRLGTGIAQMSARAPTATAMAALTLDPVATVAFVGRSRAQPVCSYDRVSVDARLTPRPTPTRTQANAARGFSVTTAGRAGMGSPVPAHEPPTGPVRTEVERRCAIEDTIIPKPQPA